MSKATSRASITFLRLEFESRRFLFVLLYVAFPTTLLACVTIAKANVAVDAVDTSRLILIGLVGLTILVSLTLTLSILRCHRGIVLNGHQINSALYGREKPAPFNPVGVSATFYMLAALSTIFASIQLIWLLTQFELTPVSFLALAAVIIIFGSASRQALKLTHLEAAKDATTSELIVESVAEQLRLDHRLMSTDATASDALAVTVMSIVMYFSLVSAAVEIIGIAKTSPPHFAVSHLRWLIDSFATYALVLMILTQITLLRLRLALIEHVSATDIMLARDSGVRNFQIFERSHLNYFLTAALAALALCVLLRQIAPPAVGAVLILAYCGASTAIYRRAVRRNLAP